MCNGAREWIILPKNSFPCSKRLKTRIPRLNRRRGSCEEKVSEKIMELKNLKLYMENLSILQENEQLRKKAILLYQENIALMSEFQKKIEKSKLEFP